MKTMIYSILTACVLFCYTDSYSQQDKSLSSDIKVAIEEIDMVMGDWTGSLTYKNYSDGSPFTMPVNLKVTKGEKANEMTLAYEYPNEPHANSDGTLKVSQDGTKLNGNIIIKKEELPDGKLLIVTEHNGKDNRKKALIKNVYILSENNLMIRKLVTYKKSDDTITRNEYSFKR